MFLSPNLNTAITPKSLELLSSLVAFTNENSIEMTADRIDTYTIQFLKTLIVHPALSQDSNLKQMCENALRILSNANSVCSNENLVNYTPDLKVIVSATQIQIDASGCNGVDGEPGGPGGFEGKSGMNGSSGGQGTDSGNIVLKLSSEGNNLIADWTVNRASLNLRDPSAFIRLTAAGGCGGHGGHGGHGADGANGANGENASKHYSGRNGKDGGSGGNGGHGSKGGDGGSGGQIQVIVDPKDADLLMLLDTPVIHGGLAGNGGYNGQGGEGGQGGKGGESYSWIENRQQTETHYDAVSKSNVTRFYTTPIHHYENPGQDGSKGPRGLDGNPGVTGIPGLDGDFLMSVGGIAYKTCYDFTIQTSKIVDPEIGSATEFSEPSECVFIALSVTNTGGMPKPQRDLVFSLQPEEWMDLVSPSALLSSLTPLNPNDTHRFPNPLIFRVKEPKKISEQPYKRQGTVLYNASFQRVQKYFLNIVKKKNVINIRYPVEILSISEKFSENIYKISTNIKNTSPYGLGEKSRNKRRLFVSVQSDSLDVSFLSPSADSAIQSLCKSKLPKVLQQEEQKTFFEIVLLEANTSKDITFSVPKTSLPSNIITELYLQQSNTLASPKVRCIQRSCKVIGSEAKNPSQI